MPTTTKRSTGAASSTARKSGTRTRRTGQTAARRTPARKTTSAAQSATTTDNIKVTIPVDEIASAALNVATVPITFARRVLPAKGGLPIYAGIGVLAVAQVIEWPIAVAAGVGYAVLRQWGPEPVRSVLSGQQPKSSERSTASREA
jgi:hypothetical protein